MAKPRRKKQEKLDTSSRKPKKPGRIFQQPSMKSISTRALSVLPPTEPATNLQLVHLHPISPHSSHKIYITDHFLTDEECRSWIQFTESCRFSPACHSASHEFAHRDCGRVSLEDKRANIALWARLKNLIDIGACDHVMRGKKQKKAVKVTRKLRIYKYEVGQRFGRHVDVSNMEDEEEDSTTGATVLIYLSDERDGLVGGETVFYDGKEVLRVKPKRGKLLVHAHGDECLEHEAKVVTAGIKYIMRSDIVYR